MTRKDYQTIARAIHAAGKHSKCQSNGAKKALSVAGDLLSIALYMDNPKFDRQRFISACENENGSK